MPKKKGGSDAAPSDYSLFQTEDGRKKIQQIQLCKLKDKQTEEDVLTKLNSAKLLTRWREILREEKAQKLVTVIESTRQHHERSLDRVDAAIDRRDADLEDAEYQHQTALQSHLVNIENLLELQAARLDAAHNQFSSELQTLEKEFDDERQNLLTNHLKEKTQLSATINRMEQEFQDVEADAKHEFQSLRDDMKNKNLEEKHALRIQLEGSIEELWRQFQKALDDYNQATEERKNQFETLKDKDFESAKVIEMQMKKLAKLQETIGSLKQKFVNNSREFEERNKSLRDEKEALQVHFQDLKKKMNLYRENEHKKLTDLTVLSNQVVRRLKDRVGTAEKLLKLVEMNHKLESEEERMLNTTDNDSSAIITEQVKSEQDNVLRDASRLPEQEQEALRYFFRRYNKENEKLKLVMKEYLEGISVSEEILAKRNCLLIVNQKTNVPLRKIPLEQDPVCIDGPQFLNSQKIF